MFSYVHATCVAMHQALKGLITDYSFMQEY